LALYVGLMSGTSLDGIDGVLVGGDVALSVRAHVHHAFEAGLRRDLLLLNEPGSDELHRAAQAANALAQAYGVVVAELLAKASVAADAVRAIGAHGQTVRHRPGSDPSGGYTVQLLNGALLAEVTGIDVVCDFRSRDLAAGGQGAPLVPAFHAACFGDPRRAVAVLNLGGIANLTLLPAHGPVTGFDCGPGNLLLDHWCQRHLGQPCDLDGAWAAGGRVQRPLLEALLADPYFDKAPPKSTGRDQFHAAWLEACLASQDATLADRDVQATLLELSARAACDALLRHAPATTTLVVCGGGAFNGALVGRISALLSPRAVISSQDYGLGPDQVEAAAFAWLAKARVDRVSGNLPGVTGARGPRILGALHPA